MPFVSLFGPVDVILWRPAARIGKMLQRDFTEKTV
jgi:hypothetical protein